MPPKDYVVVDRGGTARVRVALLLLLLVSLPGTLRAQSSDQVERVRALDERASSLFQSEDYGAALEVMLEAQALLPSAIRTYNIATCQDRLGRRDEAVALYRRFISSPEAPPERRDRALERILALQGEASEGDDSPLPSDPSPDAEEGASRRRVPPAAFWGSFGATLALGLTATVLGGVTRHLNEEFGHLTQESPRAVELETTGEGLAVATDVLLGLTAVAAVTALVLGLLADWPRRRERRHAR